MHLLWHTTPQRSEGFGCYGAERRTRGSSGVAYFPRRSPTARSRPIVRGLSGCRSVAAIMNNIAANGRASGQSGPSHAACFALAPLHRACCSSGRCIVALLNRCVVAPIYCCVPARLGRSAPAETATAGAGASRSAWSESPVCACARPCVCVRAHASEAAHARVCAHAMCVRMRACVRNRHDGRLPSTAAPAEMARPGSIIKHYKSL
jgi:hypothetical protein